MRLMSFSLTTKQVLNQTKTVTRRKGWTCLKPGDLVQPVEKCMGLKKGEKIKKIGCPIRVVSLRTEPLWQITLSDVAKEGFPNDRTTMVFMDMYCKANKCGRSQDVNRIEFEYTEK